MDADFNRAWITFKSLQSNWPLWLVFMAVLGAALYWSF